MIYPIFEVNQGQHTVLRGGTYDTATKRINPSGGNDPRDWERDINTNQNLYVVYETQDGRDYETISPSVIHLTGTRVNVTGNQP